MSDVTLVLDTTIGGASSNSYASILEAETYLVGREEASAFLALTEQEKIARLIQATMINDLLLFPYGEKTNESQSLLFPRTNLIDKHGNSYTDNVIPQKIKFAQIEEAVYLTNTNIKMPDALMQGFETAHLDVMSIKLNKSFIPKKIDSDAADFLLEFGDVTSGSMSTYKTVNVFRY